MSQVTDRRERNRLFAKESRERQKALIRSLEQEVERLRSQLHAALQENARLVAAAWYPELSYTGVELEVDDIMIREVELHAPL